MIPMLLQKIRRAPGKVILCVLVRQRLGGQALLSFLDILLIPLIKGSPLLDDQTVKRDVLRPEGCHFLQRRRQLLPGLAGQSLHQIHADIGKSRFPGLCISLQKLIIGMDPSQRPQFLLVGRLETNTQPVDAALLIYMKFFFRHRAGIALQCNLCSIFYGKRFPQNFHQPRDFFGLRQRGCPPAEENTANSRKLGWIRHFMLPSSRPLCPPVAPPASHIADFSLHRLKVRPFSLTIRRPREEITVIAFFHTKRDVKVKLQSLFPHILLSNLHPASAHS